MSAITRKVLLVEIGAGPLPSVTPVVPRTATWMPAVYTPPPPSVPGGFTATPIADAVLLTWTASDAYAPEYIVERAPDVAGVPGAWAVLGRTTDLRYTASEPTGYGAWYRVRAVSLSRYSAYTAAVVAVPISSNPPVIDLDIVAGVVTINCLYDQFRLLLNANVNDFELVNVAAQKTVIITETMGAPGGHTLNPGPNVNPISGVPYVPTPTVGARNILGLNTINGGQSWDMTVQKPSESGGGAFTLTLAPSPASATVNTDGVTPQAPSVQVTATPANGTAPITNAWTRADANGGANFLISDPAAANPIFSVAAGTTAYGPVTQTWRNNAQDAATLQAQATVDITLARTVTGGFSISLAPSPAYGSAHSTGGNPVAPSVQITATPANNTGSVSNAWSRVDGNGGSNFLISDPAAANPIFSLASGTFNTLRVQTWRCTSTDPGTGTSDFEDVEITLERTNDL